MKRRPYHVNPALQTWYLFSTLSCQPISLMLLSLSLRDDWSQCKVRAGLQGVRQPCACNTGKRRTTSNLCPRRYRQPGLLFPRLVARNHRSQTKQVRSTERVWHSKLPPCVCVLQRDLCLQTSQETQQHLPFTDHQKVQVRSVYNQAAVEQWRGKLPQYWLRHNMSASQETYTIADSRGSLPTTMLDLLHFWRGAVMQHKFAMRLCFLNGSLHC